MLGTGHGEYTNGRVRILPYVIARRVGLRLVEDCHHWRPTTMPRNHTPQLRAAGRDLRDPVTRTLRYDEHLRKQLAEAAGRAERSINSEIIFRLRSSFEQEART